MFWVNFKKYEGEPGSFINFCILEYFTCDVDGKFWWSDIVIRLCEEIYWFVI